ncbi:MAG: hypothetical protein HYX25_06025 [Candidatus Solibacter usitatus]|nr:hypothetical protein [Candidatus Solibacter usitatus]
MSTSAQSVTQLLVEWSHGDQDALERLTPLVYGELRRLARRHLSRERSDHTLQSTALVHEAYLRLVDQRSVQWQNRAHFFGVAAQLIRRILIDHARARQAGKRGSGACLLSLDEALDSPGSAEPPAGTARRVYRPRVRRRRGTAPRGGIAAGILPAGGRFYRVSAAGSFFPRIG